LGKLYDIPWISYTFGIRDHGARHDPTIITATQMERLACQTDAHSTTVSTKTESQTGYANTTNTDHSSSAKDTSHSTAAQHTTTDYASSRPPIQASASDRTDSHTSTIITKNYDPSFGTTILGTGGHQIPARHRHSTSTQKYATP